MPRPRGNFASGGKRWEIARLDALAARHPVDRLPFCLRVLLENLLRRRDLRAARAVADWPKTRRAGEELAFMPARVLMQDFTGVPAIVDLAAMREAARRQGGDPARVNPRVPVHLVVDHSLQVDRWACADARALNERLEFERNGERYRFLKWGQRSFAGLTVVPPGTGIVHQVNLEHLARVVWTDEARPVPRAFPDTVVGTDSHTTMTNGLGVLSWGVGGIEAEAVMLGQPIAMLVPEVVGVRLTGRLSAGVTATDAVLTVTQVLRKVGVVEKFVEFFGPGVAGLSVADRATIANMCPEYGATVGYFPVDSRTLEYLALTGRPDELVRLVEDYCRAQGLFLDGSSRDPEFSAAVDLDLSSVRPCVAGPRRPQDRLLLGEVKSAWQTALPVRGKPDRKDAAAAPPLRDGAVAIAAITSCTNTANPALMLGAGLLARNAVARGLAVPGWVKTSLAPGSQAIMDCLREAGLTAPLEKLGFHLVGLGCTTCIGNSGPLSEPVAAAVGSGLVVAAVLSGNRNFEGRIHPLVKASFLASPALVVAYALAGRVDMDLDSEPLGSGADGRPVYLRDIWPSDDQVRAAMSAVRKQFFTARYAEAERGGEGWRSLEAAVGELYAWEPQSTYIRLPPYFEGWDGRGRELGDIIGARALAWWGDSITTDHISPAGDIPAGSPTGRYLQERGVKPADFNSYGARRGNHEAMMRGTFANIRIRNRLLPGVEGGETVHWPDRTRMSVFDAAMRYRADSVPLIVLAGKEYGCGSSRDWAAKGPALLGVRAVLAQSFERIHRSNLVGMGILPLEFADGGSAASLGWSGIETFDIVGIAGGLRPRQRLRLTATRDGGHRSSCDVVARLDTPAEVEYYRHGGILPFVLSRLLEEVSAT